MDGNEQVTQLLISWREGDPQALDRLFPLVYEELRAIARRHLSRESGTNTIQATVLVHETYLKLIDQRQASFADRAHFLAVAAKIIRHILVDHARSKKATKRGYNLKISLDAIPEPAVPNPSAPDSGLLLDLDSALDQLELKFPGKAKLVELRYFGGLTVEETAEVLSLSPATIKRDWVTAKAWLSRAIKASPSADEYEQHPHPL
jgi:RNA polymerase sigma factor (TIGR02999 family)